MGLRHQDLSDESFYINRVRRSQPQQSSSSGDSVASLGAEIGMAGDESVAKSADAVDCDASGERMVGTGHPLGEPEPVAPRPPSGNVQASGTPQYITAFVSGLSYWPRSSM